MTDISQIPKNMPVRDAIATILGCPVDQVSAETSIMTHPKWDSLSHAQIMMFLVGRFDIDMNDQTIDQYSAFAAIQTLEDES